MGHVFTFRRQPFRGLYLTFEAFVTPVFRLPYWILVSLVPSYRPRPNWSFRRALIVRVIRYALRLSGIVGSFSSSPDHTAITGPRPGDASFTGVWVPPTPELILPGSVLDMHVNAAGVVPVRIPGYWIASPKSTLVETDELTALAAPGEKVLYHFHGGGYVTQSGHPSFLSAGIPKLIMQHVTTAPVRRAFSLEYRLSVGYPDVPAHPFPTALVDALAGYNYLLHDCKFAAQDIIVMGDSAGAHLALSLVRYLVDYHATSGGILPAPPGGLGLFSPWLDLSPTSLPSSENPNPTTATNFFSDYLGVLGTPFSFLGPLGIGTSFFNPYISPSSLKLARHPSYVGFPRTFISVGEAEILLSQTRVLVERMRKGGAEDIVYEETYGAVHDFCVLDFMEPERSELINKAVKWLEQ